MTGTDILIGKMRFCDLRPDQRKNAVKATTVASQTAPRTRNKLTAMRAENQVPEPPKAFEVCQCKRRSEGGKMWLVMLPDCLIHGIVGENLSFSRRAESVVGAGRDGRKRVRDY